MAPIAAKRRSGILGHCWQGVVTDESRCLQAIRAPRKKVMYRITLVAARCARSSRTRSVQQQPWQQQPGWAAAAAAARSFGPAGGSTGRWLSTGVSPEHYERLGLDPSATAAELQQAYTARCAKETGPLAVLKLAELAESLRATLAVAPAAASLSQSQTALGAEPNKRIQRAPGRGSVRLPENLDSGRGQTEDEMTKRAAQAMKRALAYKKNKGKAPTEDSTAATVATADEDTDTDPPIGGSDTALQDSAGGQEQQQQQQRPRWMDQQQLVDDLRTEIRTNLHTALTEAAALPLREQREAAVDKAEQFFCRRAAHLNTEIDDLNLAITIARFQRPRVYPEAVITAVKAEVEAAGAEQKAVVAEEDPFAKLD